MLRQGHAERLLLVTESRDMVDATCYDPDEPEDPRLLEKIMCGGMIKAFDRMQEVHVVEQVEEETEEELEEAGEDTLMD